MNRNPLFLLLVLLCVISGCSGNSDPSKVTAAFINAMQLDHFTEAKSYVTDESIVLIDALSTTTGRHLFPIHEGEVFNITHVRVNDKHAYVTVVLRDSHKSIHLQLNKEYNNWKVCYDINTLMTTSLDDIKF